MSPFRAFEVSTHYAVVVFSGDPASEHPNEQLRGGEPSMTLVACGSEDYCVRAIAKWTERHPLRQWESAEILERTIVPVAPAARS